LHIPPPLELDVELEDEVMPLPVLETEVVLAEPPMPLAELLTDVLLAPPPDPELLVSVFAPPPPPHDHAAAPRVPRKNAHEIVVQCFIRTTLRDPGRGVNAASCPSVAALSGAPCAT
jgi:hypothetical protein